MTKRYISLNSLNLVTDVTVGDKTVSIRFKGGVNTPYRINGSFVTANKVLQEAIESDSSYGKSFITYDIEVPQPEKTASSKVVNKVIEVPSIKTAQMAIEWVRQNLSVDLASNLPSLKIRQFAVLHGYDFPKLKIK